MPFTPASAETVAVFILIVAHVVAAFLAAVYHAYRANPDAALRATFLAALAVTVWVGG